MAGLLKIKNLQGAVNHPLFKYVQRLFGPLLRANTSVKLNEELDEIQIGLSLVNMLNQATMQVEVKSAIENYNGVVYVSLIIFTLNLIMGLGRIIYLIYLKSCTPETFKK